MRSSTNLPSLHLPHANNPSSLTSRKKRPKDSVREIEQILAKQSTQIQRNQHVIMKLTAQFKHLKEQLQTQIEQNQQISAMYSNSIDENRQLMLTIKELKKTVSNMEKLSQEPRKSVKDCVQKSGVREINKLKEENRALEARNADLQAQMQKYQQQFQIAMSTNQIREKSTHNIINQHKKSINELKNLNQTQKQQIKALKSQIEQFQLSCDEKHRIITALQSSNQQLQSKLVQKSQQTNNLQQKYAQLMRQINRKQGQSDKSAERQTELRQIQQLKLENIRLNRSLQKVYEEINQYKLLIKETQLRNQQLQLKAHKKIGNIKKDRQKLKNSADKIRLNIICQHCSCILSKPVTNIPCGHSYCQQCKVSYEKGCKQCGVKGVKREAVYRNQLLDEIISAYTILDQCSKTLLQNY